MDKAHNALLARVGTALYQQDDLQQADLDAVYDEIEALVAEVERLRAEVAAERAAVVAWLKKQRMYCTDSTGEPNAVTATYAHAADAIERGDHRREEKP